VSILLKAGADPARKNRLGGSALTLAEKRLNQQQKLFEVLRLGAKQ
jgi:hypothetical protein